MLNHDEGDGPSQHQEIQMIPEESELTIMQNETVLIIGSRNEHGDEYTVISKGTCDMEPELETGLYQEEIISSTITSLTQSSCEICHESLENQYPVDHRRPFAGDEAADPVGDELSDDKHHTSQPIIQSDDNFQVNDFEESTFGDHYDEEIDKKCPDGSEQVSVRTEVLANDETTPIPSPPSSFDLVRSIDACEDSPHGNHLDRSDDIHAHCYYMENIESAHDKESSLPSLQWFPLTSSSTHSNSGTHGNNRGISRGASGDFIASSESRDNPVYPVLATPIHEPTTISARLLHDQYPKLYDRCARMCGTKRKRRILCILLCFLLIATVLSLVIGYYFGFKKAECSHICYEDVSFSIRTGWSPSLCPLAKCYSNSRVKFMSYWQVWCSLNLSNVQKCNDVIVVMPP